jgi:hypothetical protein
VSLSLDRVSDAIAQRNFDRIGQKVDQPLPQASVFNSANISIATSALRQWLTFDSENYDTGNFHSTTTNTGRLTAPVPGLYLIGASVEFASNATGYRELDLRVNGSTFIAADRMPAASGGAHIMSTQRVYQLDAGDYVETGVIQVSGGALNVVRQSAWSPEFWIVRLGGYTSEALTG